MASSTHAAVSIAIGASLGRHFKQTFSSASKQLTIFGKMVTQCDKRLQSIDSFKQSRQATLQAKQAWQQAEHKVGELARSISKTDRPSKTLQANFRKAKNAARLAKTQFVQTKAATRQLGVALSKAGVDTKHLTVAQIRLGATLAKVKKQQASLAGVMEAKQRNLNRRMHYRSQMMDAMALGGALYGVVRPAVDFELAMAKVGAITNEAAGSSGFNALTRQARELGRTTQYTASQTAEAMRYLGMTGMKTNQILKATPAVLNMAVAANMDLGRAADIASNILTGFNLDASRTAEVADVLAQASRTANVDVEMLGQTMKFVAPAASAVGGSLQETAAIAGVLGDAGIQATMAGTMLRSAYLRLAAPAKAGSHALNKLRHDMGVTAQEMPDVAKEAVLAQQRLSSMGVAVFDNAGKMRSMVDILKDMSVALNGMSDKDKLSAVKDIFGTRASAGALAIFKSIDTGRFDEVMDKMNHADGAAQAMASRLKNTTFGAFKQLTSALESVGISIGSVLLPAFSQIALGVAKVAGKLSQFADSFPRITKVIGLTIASLISFKVAAIAVGYTWTFLRGGFLAAKAAVIGFRGALLLMNVTMAEVRVGGIISSLLSFGSTLGSIAMSAIPTVITAIRGMNLALLTSPIGLIIGAIAAGAGLIIHYWKPLSQFFSHLFTPVIAIFKKVLGWINKVWEKAQAMFKHIKQWVGNSFIGKTWHVVVGGDKKNRVSGSNTVNTTTQSAKLGDISRVMTATSTSATQSASSNIIPLYPTANPNLHGNNTNQTTTTVHINAPITIQATQDKDEQAIAAEVKRALTEMMQENVQRKQAANY